MSAESELGALRREGTKADRDLAQQINDYWVARGVNAGAKAGSRIGKTKAGTSFSFPSIVSSLTGREQS